MLFISEQYNNSAVTRLIFLVIGLTLNAMGNGLTVASNSGAAVWTASAVNLDHILNISVALVIFAYGVINIIINQLLLWKFDFLRIVKEFAFILFFSYGVGFFTKIFSSFGIGSQGFLINALFSILGITIIGIAISISQRANLLMHPNDGTTNILRFKYCKGSAPLSQFIDMLPPVIAIIITVVVTGHIYAVSVGTVYYFLCNGIVIKYADRLIAPKLVHNFNKNENFSRQ